MELEEKLVLITLKNLNISNQYNHKFFNKILQYAFSLRLQHYFLGFRRANS